MRVTETENSVDPLELAAALFDNADQLLSDAALLLGNGRHARAAALAVIAIEELSKSYL